MSCRMSFSKSEMSGISKILSHHSSSIASALDQISFFMVYPWATVLSKIIAYYFIPDLNSFDWWSNVKEKFLFGPLLCIFFLGLFPVGVAGFLLWIFICSAFPRKKYSYLELGTKGNKQSEETKEVFTLACANVLLANEVFCRWNNNGNPMARSKLIGQKLLQQTPYYLQNLLLPQLCKKDTVIADLPDVDILCVQEVWERYWAATMIDQLGLKYSYFIHDVGDHRLTSNCCLFGSGLFVACKYPILAVEFQPFQFRTHYAKFFSYGVLCLKIQINKERIAYVANLHGQAYQGKEPVLYHQLSESLSAINAFRLKTRLPEENVIFDAVCGDFNFDNMSPGDAATQNHPLFNQYIDACSKKPGEDHHWTVGTELRQLRMHEPIVSTAEALRHVLIDDVKRRQYVLDADVVEQTTALASIDPSTNEDGKVVRESWGGKRRIDRILLRKDSPAQVVGYGFSSVLAGLTDHIPVAVSLKVTTD
ncbi:sphingomyelin phosphodiesterase 3-like [Daphnia carinata]|uniref:sphingomyelin phosphodiesterase 3-like n=1 Tax=Daphnia carinata TaxID=120202 RepID=UPI002580A517|nr:sphingomyelin phosphodiesterase 3-like [Daphnia carinata]